MGVVISILNNKGGVSKTTTAVNLGAALVTKGKTVLLIDFDPQHSLTSYLNVQTGGLSCAEMLLSSKAVQDYIIKTAEGFDIIPSSAKLSVTELDLTKIMMARESVLKKRIAPLMSKYDYIIIDNSPSLSLLVINALVASSHVLIPLEPDLLALKGLESVLETIYEVQSNTGGSPVVLGVLASKVDARIKHHQEIWTHVKNKYDTFNIVIKLSAQYKDAALASQSIMAYRPNSEHARAFDNLAEEVINRA